MDDNQWETTEEFFLKLSLTGEDENVKLGKVSIMEITILDDDGRLLRVARCRYSVKLKRAQCFLTV